MIREYFKLFFKTVLFILLNFKLLLMELCNDITSSREERNFYKFCTNKVSRVEPSGNRVRNIPCPVPRSGHRIVIYKGNIFAFGGYSPRNPETNEIIHPSNNRHLFKELWKFNFASKTWFKLKTSGPMPAELASHAAVLIENHMLVYGGTGVPFGHSSSNSTHLCNLNSFEWFKLKTEGDRPTPLYGQAITLHNNMIYVIGGTAGYEYSINVHCLDLHSKIWTQLDGNRKNPHEPSPRYRHEIVIFEDKIYVLGGGTAFDSFDFVSIPVFDLKENTWDKMTATTSDSTHPQARLCHGCIQVGSDVYICGGHNWRTIFSDVWKLNLITLQWQKINIELPIPLYFHSMSMSEEGQVFIFGGVTNTQDEIRTNEIFSFWLKIPSLSDMCWQALLTYIPDIAQLNRQKLFQAGVPSKYLEQVDFLTDRSNLDNWIIT